MTNTHKNFNETEYVEVELNIDLTYYRPTTDHNGELTFTQFPLDPALSFIKCRVPHYAIKDKKTLTEYVEEEMCNYDLIEIDEVNIWDGDHNTGWFRFPL